MEIIVFYELVQIYGKHFEAYAYVTSEGEVAFYADYVLLIFVVTVSERFQDFDLDFALFVELLPILKNFDSNWLFVLVVIAPQDDTKGTSA